MNKFKILFSAFLAICLLIAVGLGVYLVIQGEPFIGVGVAGFTAIMLFLIFYFANKHQKK